MSFWLECQQAGWCYSKKCKTCEIAATSLKKYPFERDIDLVDANERFHKDTKRCVLCKVGHGGYVITAKRCKKRSGFGIRGKFCKEHANTEIIDYDRGGFWGNYF